MKKMLAMMMVLVTILTMAQACAEENWGFSAMTPGTKIEIGFQMIGSGISDAWNNFTTDAGKVASNVKDNVGAAASAAGEKISETWNTATENVKTIDWKFWD